MSNNIVLCSCVCSIFVYFVVLKRSVKDNRVVYKDIFIEMCICVCLHVCECVCVRLWIPVRTYVRMCICTYVIVCARESIGMRFCMSVPWNIPES